MRRLLAGVGFLACVGLQAEENLADFWQRGRVRELLVSGIDGVSLPQWRDAGVNCVMGV
jgi:hypothetical protein